MLGENVQTMAMPIWWKLRARRGARLDFFVARAPDKQTAIAAVRTKRAFVEADIEVMEEAPPAGDLSWLALEEGLAQATLPTPVAT